MIRRIVVGVFDLGCGVLGVVWSAYCLLHALHLSFPAVILWLGAAGGWLFLADKSLSHLSRNLDQAIRELEKGREG